MTALLSRSAVSSETVRRGPPAAANHSQFVDLAAPDAAKEGGASDQRGLVTCQAVVAYATGRRQSIPSDHDRLYPGKDLGTKCLALPLPVGFPGQ